MPVFKVSRGYEYSYIIRRPVSAPKAFVLFLHGWPSIGLEWHHQLDHFHNQGYAVIAPDLLGSGHTSRPADVDAYLLKDMAKDIVEILDHEQVVRFIGVGHDWGSSLLGRLAVYFPERIENLAFITVGYTPPGTRFDIDLVNEQSKQALGYAAFGYQDHRKRREATADGLGGLPTLAWYKANVRNLNYEAEKDIAEENKYLHYPTLYLTSAKDYIAVPRSMLPRMKPWVPDLEVQEIDSGHWAFLHYPEFGSLSHLHYIMATEQRRVSIPTVKDGDEWPSLFRIYLNCLTWILRKLVLLLTGPNEGHDLKVKIDTPGLGAGYVVCNIWLPRPTEETQAKHPLVLVLEGGVFVLGHPKDGRLNNRRIVDQTGAIVMSVNYAKAPRYPYPHALLQAYEVLRWSLTRSATLEGIYVDPLRVAIGGNSAGGNLTAALSLLLSFRSGPCSIFRDALPLDFKQVLHFMFYPSLELRLPYDLRLTRSTSDAQKHSLPAWMARAMEHSYLPPRVFKDDIFVFPVAASVDLLRELDIPPAVLFTGSLDCLKEEGFRYAQNLTKSGKEVIFHEFQGGTHGFSVKPQDGSTEAQAIYEECWARICHSLKEAFL
ncbi:carboxylesterase [Fusarium mexicanum]|uniref:Carboxylesterase n=1 Tax=Fusarium mexicanum TaxID=751941 RepID=A0A8H5J1F6_9HYPO|nr:carboxylesterase [Fusarium mexicanum]